MYNQEKDVMKFVVLLINRDELERVETGVRESGCQREQLGSKDNDTRAGTICKNPL